METIVPEIMNTSKIRKELHEYINKGDERFLRLIHAVVTAYESDEEDFTLPGTPMDVENYKVRIQKAREQVKSGYYTTQEDLEKEMKRIRPSKCVLLK